MKYLIVLSFLCVQVFCFGQAPEGINYQAVVRDDAGNVIQNNNVGLKMSLYQSAIGGTLIYEESFTSTTDNFGLVNLVIGQGNVLSGDFISIDWSSGPYYIEISADENGGSDYQVIGSQQLMSVPYALYSKTSGNPIPGPQGEEGPQGAQGDPGPQGDPGTNGTNGVLPNGTEIGNTTFWDGTEWVVDNNNIYNDGNNVGVNNNSPIYKLDLASENLGIRSEITGFSSTAIYGHNTSAVGGFGIVGQSDGSTPGWAGIRAIAENGSHALITDGPTLFNVDQQDFDLQIQGISDVNLLYSDAGNNNIGIGTGTPAAKLEVFGGDIAINSPFKYKVKDAMDGDNFLMYEPTVDGVRLNGYDAVFITTNDPSNATAGQDLVVRNGRVGINTNTPSQGLLHVNGYYPDPFGAFTYYAPGPNTGTGAPANLNTSIFATHRVVAGEFNAISDARIKKIDGVSNSKEDLNTLKRIEITNYHMIDPSHGEKPMKKLIAQQLEEVYPQAVSTSKNSIPDIYKIANCKEGSIQLDNNLNKGDRVRLIFENKEEITSVLSATPKSFKVNLSESGKVFVYGREVDDFRTVDYQAVSMLNVSATQELLKRVEELERENLNLKASNEELLGLKDKVETLERTMLLILEEKNTSKINH